MPRSAAAVERGAQRSPLLLWSVRVGLVAYALLHWLVAWICLRLAFGGGAPAPTSNGAMAQLTGQAFGDAALVALVAGFVVLAVWQALACAVGYRDRDGLQRLLMRIGAGCRTIIYGYLAFSAAGTVAMGRGSASQGGNAQGLSERAMAYPAGLVILASIGVAVAATGIGMVVFGLRKDFLEQLDERARNRDRRTAIVVVGQVGYVAKGLAITVIGALLVWAAVTHDPSKAGGLDQALHELLGETAGTVAVAVVGVGIGVFGFYLVARSWHLDNESLTR